MAGHTSEIAYLCIYNCHSGEHARIPKPVRFLHLSDFKQYLVEAFGMDSVENVYLLTSFGIKLNFGVVNELTDVYCYDKRLFSNSPDKALVDEYSKIREKAANPVTFNLPEGVSNIKEITNNLKTNGGWSNSILQSCYFIEKRVKELVKQINIIFKSLTIIFQFGTNFINEFEKSFNNFHSYINLLSLKSLHSTWRTQYNQLKRFPVVAVGKESFNLVDFLEQRDLSEAAQYVESNLPEVVNRFNSIGEVLNNVNADKLSLDHVIEEMRNDSINEFKDVNTQSIIQEVETNGRKISTDLDTFSNSGNTDVNSLYQDHIVYSRNIFEQALKLFSYSNSLGEFKIRLFKETLGVFSSIANLQLKIVNMKEDLKTLTSPSKTNNVLSYNTINLIKKSEDHLSLTIDLPLIFGFLLIEKRRQFEWYDFFSKGIVHNVSEQLTTIIEHEKLFRRLWVKKFGSFLTMISKDADFGTLPNIDVTLFNNKPEVLLSKISSEIERKDITNYIKLVSDYQGSSSFAELLDKNYNDLIQSTNNMKKITKIVSGLSTPLSKNNETKLVSHGKQEKSIEEIDYDSDLVKGLKSRIKKLEHLLHQQQYKNLSNWPVTKSPGNGNEVGSLMIEKNGQVASHFPKIDPTSLLQRRSTLPTKFQNSPSDSSSTILDTTPIDKHLENIRLKKENDMLQNQQKVLQEENESRDKEMEKLKRDLKVLEMENSKLKDDLNSVIKEKSEEIASIKMSSKIDTKEISNLAKKVAHRDEMIDHLESENTKLKEANVHLKQELESLSANVKNLENELSDTKNMKNDLLSNMSSKESENVKERNRFEEEIKILTAKLEEVTDDYENLMEITESGHKDNEFTINELNIVISTLLVDIQKLASVIFDYFVECCLILESMGLLLVSESDQLKISRVKGLRSKTPNENKSETMKPVTTVVSDFSESISWIKDLDLTEEVLKSVSSDENEPLKYAEIAARLISIFNDWFKDDDSPFAQFLSIAKFEKHFASLDERRDDHKLFLGAVSKRFNDVEGYAKKQSKESRSNANEVNKLRNRLNSKISMNNFKKNDLVLFLPTKIENVEPKGDYAQPWAAFNIGAPHYFLKGDNSENLTAKDWMVGRVMGIEEHTVTAENVDDKSLNPFQLSEGITWYMLDAKEESM